MAESTSMIECNCGICKCNFPLEEPLTEHEELAVYNRFKDHDTEREREAKWHAELCGSIMNFTAMEIPQISADEDIKL